MVRFLYYLRRLKFTIYGRLRLDQRGTMDEPHLSLTISEGSMSTLTSLGDSAEHYTTLDWKILPCHGVTTDGRCTCGGTHSSPKDMGKHPAIAGWNTVATTDAAQVRSWWYDNPDYNLGVFCQGSGFFVIDIDPRSGGDESFARFESLVEGGLPATVEAVTGLYTVNKREVRGRHLYYKVASNERLIGNLKELDLPGIDIKHNGYVLLPPSRHISGVSYQWRGGHAPWEIAMADAPEELLGGIRKGRPRTGTTASTSGAVSTSLGQFDWSFVGDLDFKGKKLDLEKLAQEGITEGSRAVELYAMACALANTVDVNTSMGANMVETTMIRFNAEMVKPPLELEGPTGLLGHVRRAIEFVKDNPKTSGVWADSVKEWEKEQAVRIGAHVQETAQKIVSAIAETNTSDPDDMDSGYDMYTAPGTIGGAVSSGALSGLSYRDAAKLTNINVPKDPDALTIEEGGAPGRRSLTDVGNGRRLIDAYQSLLRYTPGLGWHNWGGTHWESDPENLALRELAKQMAAGIASEVVEYEEKDKNDVLKWANLAKSTSRMDSAIKAATSDPRISVKVDQWDSNPYLLGVKNGVVDLRTGALLHGRPDLHITKTSPVAYTPGHPSARWMDFLDFATGGDKELQDWLQRAVGYTITGLSTLDILFLVYGKPGSGKNTFVEAVVKMMGTKEYAMPMDSSILAQKDGMSSSTDMYHWAELRGRRMVWFDELPDGERIKENTIKKITGSSEIPARSPGERPFTFQAQAKPWITTNHRPIITDDAMWRRLRPIPWMHVPETPDPSLKEYLFDKDGGLPAILAWAVEGAMKFLASPSSDGLGWCIAVDEAAEVYRKREDRMGKFIASELQETPGGSVPTRSLYNIYRLWAENRGEKVLAMTTILKMLGERDFMFNADETELLDYTLKARAPSTTDADLDWSYMSRFAN
ncbi:MAG: phage/plasmid primase, P4 family [Cetobacterium sp.]